ncbi:MAG: DinB family protein [Janthinobacterium lividum]
MHLSAAIAQHVLDVHTGGNWTEVDLAHTLADVTLAEANTRTPASANTLASLVRHLAFWNRVMARRAHGQPTEINRANGFDAGPPLGTEADWQALRADLTCSGQELAAAIRAVPDEQLPAAILPGYSSAYKNLQGAVEHLHYHLGQLVILKNLVRARPAAA